MNFKNGDTVSTPYGQGIVWKITEKTVHVKHGDGENATFSKYHFYPTHHMQTPIEKCKKIEVNQ